MFVLAILTLQTAAGQTTDNPLDPTPEPSPARAAPSNALDKTDLEFYVRHLRVWGPEITIEVGDFQPTEIDGLLKTTVRASHKLQSQELVFYVSQDGRHIMEAKVYGVAQNPFQSDLEKIDNRDLPGFGKEGAPVAIAVYSDFQCPYCGKEGRLLRTQIPKNYPEQVRVYYHDFPLRTHNWAMEASVAGRCIYELEPDAFWKYHDWVFDNQKNITPQNIRSKIGEFASAEGLDSLKLSPCIEGSEAREYVEALIEDARKVKVNQTPTIFVNGRRLAGNLNWERLKRIIDYELEYQEITKNAGDDCGCEVEAAFPGEP